jgi:hypothetical protein
MEHTDQFLTPTELLKKYPVLSAMGWTVSDIGVLHKCGVLRGYHKRSSRMTLVSERSLLQLVRWMKDNDSRNLMGID